MTKKGNSPHKVSKGILPNKKTAGNKSGNNPSPVKKMGGTKMC